MQQHAPYLLAAVSFIGIVSMAHAQDSDTRILLLPQDLAYKGAAGAPATAVLYGDPSKPGIYVTRLKIPAGTKSMPHWHPDTMRMVTVMSGTFYFSPGEQWDESTLKAYPAGTFYSEPPRAAHYWWAKDGEVILQITAMGPTGNTPIAPRK